MQCYKYNEQEGWSTFIKFLRKYFITYSGSFTDKSYFYGLLAIDQYLFRQFNKNRTFDKYSFCKFNKNRTLTNCNQLFSNGSIQRDMNVKSPYIKFKSDYQDKIQLLPSQKLIEKRNILIEKAMLHLYQTWSQYGQPIPEESDGIFEDLVSANWLKLLVIIKPMSAVENVSLPILDQFSDENMGRSNCRLEYKLSNLEIIQYRKLPNLLKEIISKNSKKIASELDVALSYDQESKTCTLEIIFPNKINNDQIEIFDSYFLSSADKADLTPF